MSDTTNPIFKFSFSVNGGSVAEWLCLVVALTFLVHAALSVWQTVLQWKIDRMKKEADDAERHEPPARQ